MRSWPWSKVFSLLVACLILATALPAFRAIIALAGIRSSWRRESSPMPQVVLRLFLRLGGKRFLAEGHAAEIGEIDGCQAALPAAFRQG